MDRIVSQLVQALKDQGVSPSAASLAAAGNKSVIKNLMNRRGVGKISHPIDNLLKIADYYDLEVYVGPPRRPPSNHEVVAAAYLAREFVCIPFHPELAKAFEPCTAGDDLDAVDVAFRVEWLVDRGLKPDQCVGLWFKGDSMSPTIEDGDHVLLDRTRTNARAPGVYGLIVPERGAMIRRLERTETHLLLHADNRDHATIALCPEDAERVSIIGRVAWHGHTWTFGGT